MPSPVGHALGGLTLWLAAGGTGRGNTLPAAVAAVAAVSVLPDLDFLPGLLAGSPSRWHHEYTHSLFFALGVCVCIMLGGVLIKGSPRVWLRRGALVGALTALHLGLDLVTADPNPPVGLRLLWPLNGDYFISPWTFLDRVRREPLDWSLPGIWARIALKETIILGAPLAGLLAWKGRDRRKSRP